MSGPNLADWISAGSSVVQTVGALTAIGVTVALTRRAERESARREREAIEREAAAREAAEQRAEVAIGRAAAAEKRRVFEANARLSAIACGAMDAVVEDLRRQIEAIPPERRPDLHILDPDAVVVDWTSADGCIVTLESLSARTDDPLLAMLFEQTCQTLRQPQRAGLWDRRAAASMLGSLVTQLETFRDRTEKAVGDIERALVLAETAARNEPLAM